MSSLTRPTGEELKSSARWCCRETMCSGSFESVFWGTLIQKYYVLQSACVNPTRVQALLLLVWQNGERNQVAENNKKNILIFQLILTLLFIIWRVQSWFDRLYQRSAQQTQSNKMRIILDWETSVRRPSAGHQVSISLICLLVDEGEK